MKDIFIISVVRSERGEAIWEDSGLSGRKDLYKFSLL
jgi:hypothetical protein